MFSGSSRLKWYPRLGVFKNSTGSVEFNPTTKQARSYNWTFLAEVNGVLIFNNYRWSQTTSCHQHAVRSVLSHRGLKYISVDLGETSPKYLGKRDIEKLFKQLFETEIEIETATQKESGVQNRRHWLKNSLEKDIQAIVEAVPSLKISQKRQKELWNEAVENKMNELSEKQAEKVHKILCINEAKSNFEAIQL